MEPNERESVLPRQPDTRLLGVSGLSDEVCQVCWTRRIPHGPEVPRLAPGRDPEETGGVSASGTNLPQKRTATFRMYAGSVIFYVAKTPCRPSLPAPCTPPPVKTQ